MRRATPLASDHLFIDVRQISWSLRPRQPSSSRFQIPIAHRTFESLWAIWRGRLRSMVRHSLRPSRAFNLDTFCERTLTASSRLSIFVRRPHRSTTRTPKTTRNSFACFLGVRSAIVSIRFIRSSLISAEASIRPRSSAWPIVSIARTADLVPRFTQLQRFTRGNPTTRRLLSKRSRGPWPFLLIAGMEMSRAGESSLNLPRTCRGRAWRSPAVRRGIWRSRGTPARGWSYPAIQAILSPVSSAFSTSFSCGGNGTLSSSRSRAQDPRGREKSGSGCCDVLFAKRHPRPFCEFGSFETFLDSRFLRHQHGCAKTCEACGTILNSEIHRDKDSGSVDSSNGFGITSDGRG